MNLTSSAFLKRLEALEASKPETKVETLEPETAAALLAAATDAGDAVMIRTGRPKLAGRAARFWLLAVWHDIKAGITEPRPSLRAFHPTLAPDAPRELDPAAAAELDQLIRDVGGDPTQPPKPIPLGNPYARSGSRHMKDLSDYD